jgi:hypothetical protein
MVLYDEGNASVILKNKIYIIYTYNMLSSIPSNSGSIVKQKESDDKKDMLKNHYEKILQTWAMKPTQKSITLRVLSDISLDVYNEWKKTFEEKKYVVTLTDKLFIVALS